MSAPSVVFLNGVYPPQPGATGDLLADLAAGLAARGWAVRIVTSGAGLATPDVPGVTVERVAGGPRRGRIWRRAVAYGALDPRLVRAALRGPQPDVVVVGADPPLLFLAGPWLRRRTGAAVVHWAQDLYPDVAEALGVLRPGGVAARALGRQARHALRRVDAVVTIGRCMADRLADLDPVRVATIPNWAPADVRPLPGVDTPFRKAHGLDGRFVVMYSGTLGLAHPFDAVLDAAALLAATDPDVVFVVVGDGARRAEVEADAARRRLANLLFAPPQPRASLADSLGAADLHIVTMDMALLGLVVPSKVYGALAAGRPVVFVGPAASEAARVVAEHDAGTVVGTGAVVGAGRAVAAAVRAWRADPARRAAAGARAAAAAAGGRDAAVAAFDAVLRKQAGRL